MTVDSQVECHKHYTSRPRICMYCSGKSRTFNLEFIFNLYCTEFLTVKCFMEHSAFIIITTVQNHMEINSLTVLSRELAFI